jgi:hypothetical protein
MIKETQTQAFTLTPTSMTEALSFAKLIAESDLVPKDYKGKPGNVLVAVQMGLELGLPPLQAIQGITVINGRPSVWGDALLALVRASPHFESIEEEQSETEAVCRVKRRGEAAISRSFSFADATKARLTNKEGPWQQYPRRMLQMRARAFALRDAFADVLKGISMAEEAQDMPDHSRDIEGTTVDDLNARLAARLPKPKPVLAEVLKQIADAQTKTQLESIGPLANALPDADRDAAREAYKARVKTLAEAAQNRECS